MPLGPAPAARPKDLRIAFIDSNPLVKVSADTASVVQQTVRLLSKAGAKVKRAEPEGIDWRQGWDDWADLFQYQVRALQPLAERERTFERVNSSDPSARSVGRTARLDLGEFLAVLERRDLIMRQCEAFLDDYDAWLMPVMPDAAFIRQKQSAPLVIDGTPHPYFFAGTSYNFLANLTGQPSIVLPCGFSKEGLPIGLQLTGKSGTMPSCSASPRCWRSSCRLVPCRRTTGTPDHGACTAVSFGTFRHSRYFRQSVWCGDGRDAPTGWGPHGEPNRARLRSVGLSHCMIRIDDEKER